MNLNRVRNVKANFDALEADSQAVMRAEADEIKKALGKSLPALPEADRAAVAWYIAETLDAVRSMRVSDVGTILTDSAVAYALAAVDLLGWQAE